MQNSTVVFQLNFSNNIGFCASISRPNAKPENEIGVEETKAGIDSKISRGSFRATFLLQCLTVIGCQKIEIEDYESQLLMVAEPNEPYKKSVK